jgi:hypothetical protein
LPINGCKRSIRTIRTIRTIFTLFLVSVFFSLHLFYAKYSLCAPIMHTANHTYFRCLPAFLLALVGVVVFVSFGIAQKPPASSSIIFDHLSDPIIAQNVVYSIVQDSRGFLWFGTNYGLYRFDGYRFRVFTNNPLDSTSLTDDRVLNVYEDRDGDLWCTTQDGGLNRFHRKTATFTRFPTNPKKPQSISSNRTSFIYQDRALRLWIGTEPLVWFGWGRFVPVSSRNADVYDLSA